jgi:uncharacterized protein (TIGR03437 family)
VADRAGNLFVVSNVCAVDPCPAGDPSTIQVTRTDLSGNVLGVFSFGGSGRTVAYAAAMDTAGNLVLGGSTRSPDFPVVSALQTTGGAFLTKFDPMLQGIVYSTRFGSAGTSTSVNAIAGDGDGNIYLTGTTSAGLPVTPGAFQTQGSVAINAASAYVAEISASGSTLVFATYYSGTLATALVGTGLGGLVPFQPPVTSPNAISVDSAGNIVVAGSTSDNLPVTSGAYSTVAPTSPFDTVGFAAKFKPGGTDLVWATYLPHAVVYSMVQDSAGGLVLAGGASSDFATTTNAIQPSFPPTPSPPSGALIGSSAGFVLKLASTGDKPMNATYFGGNTIAAPDANVASSVNGLAMDEAGNVWITGNSSPFSLPSNSGPTLGQRYVAELSPDLDTVMTLNSVPDGSAGVAIASAPGGTIATIGNDNLLLLTNPGAGSSGPSFLGLASSPGFRTSPAIAPAELVTLYGIGIGPAAGQAAQIGSDGVIGTELGGAQVLFNGTPAAMLYAGPNQINAIVPEAVSGLGETSVQIVTPAATINISGLTVQDYVPTMFGTIGQVAAPVLNEDGTINGPSNPAPAGSIVAVWLTGAGSAAGTDNQVNIPAARPSSAPISVLAYQPSGIPLSLDVLYAGDAPNQPNGVSQINFRLPATSANFLATIPPFNVRVGSVTSLPFQIYLQ